MILDQPNSSIDEMLDLSYISDLGSNEPLNDRVQGHLDPTAAEPL